jgi:hypothetical protein
MEDNLLLLFHRMPALSPCLPNRTPGGGSQAPSSLFSSSFYARIFVFGPQAKMLSLAVWLTTLVLEALLLLRASRGEFLGKYRLFYLYLGGVFLQSFSLLIIYLAKSKYYASLYWSAEFVSVVLGCGVVWEIYRGALGRFPGAARMARNVLLVVLLMVISRVLANSWNSTVWPPAGTVVELERDLRAVQSMVLIGLVLVVRFYRIPLGQNLWGMMLGYGLFIGTNVITLALGALLGNAFQTPWRYLGPLSYLAVLCIWSIALWSYKAAPVPGAELQVEQDYRFLAEQTKRGLLHARAYLIRAMRP